MNKTHVINTLIEAANRLDIRIPTVTTKKLFQELLAYLKALRDIYQTMHWQAKGDSYYGDHLLHEKLYNAVSAQVDALAEKMIGYTDDASLVDVLPQTARVATLTAEILAEREKSTDLQCVLLAERNLCMKLIPKMLSDMENAGELSDGVENMLQGLADEHEALQYHIQRRLKSGKEVPTVAPNISPPPQNTEE